MPSTKLVGLTLYIMLTLTLVLLAISFGVNAYKSGFEEAFLRLSSLFTASGAILGTIGYSSRDIKIGRIVGYTGVTLMAGAVIIGAILVLT